ncbi:cytochrome P450 [Vararia minispora EC-137]|uniref:Cytochrome P450 n=1 Tax=Vararia minispora EC-137 TaxID=1314806 RepID=A0ACB8QVV0_9AGAM|nr:cytochrome P450 [Vararia minispora EC-137]
MITKLILSAAAGLLALCIGDFYRLFKAILHPFLSPLRNVPGPKTDGILLGNFKALTDPEPRVMYEEWFDRLFLLDPRAVAHVLRHPGEYPKPEIFRNSLKEMLGDGLLVVEGDAHRRERRIMSPAFGAPQIRELIGIFFDKSLQLRDIWLQETKSEKTLKKPLDTKHSLIEATRWLDKVTLDVIGLAGRFNYSFDALNPAGSLNELNQAVRDMMNSSQPSFLDLLHIIFPVTRIISSTKDRCVKNARRVMERVGRDLLADMKVTVQSSTVGSEGPSRKDVRSRDLLSLLVRANMANDVADGGRLTDEEVLAQIPTFLFAGHETTSAALAWTFYALSCNPTIQEKLRTELRACSEGDRPSMTALNNLAYLDAVVHETIRLYAPVSATVRDVSKDDIIPTGMEWVDKKGVRHSGISVVKGDAIIIPILAINRSKEIWGEDAYEFKPERWSNLPPSASAIPGIWGNSLSFLGGSRACIGYRFSVMEMKAIIYTLVRTFRFSLAADPADIQVRLPGITRPYLRNQIDKGPQLPLWVCPIEDERAAVA